MSYSLEKKFEIWDDDTGGCISIGPDSDGIGCLEIQAKDDQGKVESSIFFSSEQIPLLIVALRGLEDK
jgi:hypothetical protein